MKYWRGVRGCLVAGVAIASSSLATPVEPNDGRAEFSAFLAESNERSRALRLNEILLERRKLERNIAERGRAYVHLVRTGLLPLSRGFDAMLRHASRAERLRRAVLRDLGRRDELAHEEQQLRATIQRLRQQRALLVDQVADYQRSKEAILAARDRDAAYRRAFESEWRPSSHSAVYAAPPRTTGEEAFAELKGRLPLPVAGRSEIRPIRLPDALGEGAFLAVQPGAEVSAVFGGKVILTGEYGEVGRSVLIDHGGGYSTLSAHLGVITVEAGDAVTAGDSIGKLAEGGDGNLYFEVRSEGSTMNPAEWFGL